jgi:hypothetical protein
MIIEGRGPDTYCGEGLIVALHSARGLNVENRCLAQCTLSLALGARGSLSSFRMYMANCPCCKGLIIIPSTVAILGKGFVAAFFGERLVVALLNGCVLLGILVVFSILAVLTLSAVHAIFSVLAVLAFGIFCAAGCSMARCDHRCIPRMSTCKFDCCVGVVLVLPLHFLLLLSLLAIQHKEMIVTVINVCIMALQSILLLVFCAFANR